ncbi:hypothetical protein N9K26_02425 [Flavobacteriales bacterium]|nr:hypothetical protein [Flavobacteriales bacterium]MDB4051877.1 hypothetical protein [Flavobacteriales bacterium]
MTKFLFTYIVLSLSVISFSQERQGMIHDNYNPVYGQFMNPANIVDSKVWLDINIVGVEAYARNNFLFFSNSSLIGAINNDFEDVRFSDVSNDIRAIGTGDIIGPSASLIVGRHSFAVFSNVRAVTNVNNVPGVLGKFIEAGEVPTVDIGNYTANNARYKSMAWSEIGRLLKYQFNII